MSSSLPKLIGAGLAHGVRGLTWLLGRRAGARAAAHAASVLAPVLSAKTPRGTLRFRCGSAMAARQATGFAQHEPDTRSWIDEHIRPGNQLWDIGANIGVYSLYASLTPEVSVLAFEPVAATFALLAQNIALNGLAERITPFCLALSDSSGVVPIYLASAEAGTAMHALGSAENVHGRFQPAGLQMVMTLRGDSLAAQLGLSAPHHVKLDVDGHELRVLQGMGDLLNGIRSIWVEIEGGGTGIAEHLTARGFETGPSYGGRNQLFLNRKFAG